MRKFFIGWPLAASLFLIAAYPAEARVTVVDGGTERTIGGYCTPGTPVASDCMAQALPFTITLGGANYDSFILNGNGTLTLGNAGIDWSTVSNTPPNLAAYAMPVFSPQNDNSIAYKTIVNMTDGTTSSEADTKWAASVTTGPGTLTAYWFPCGTAIFCGRDSLPAELYDGFGLTHDQVVERQSWGMFGLTLTDLGAGSFELSYFYYPVYTAGPNYTEQLVTDPQGTYGFNVPGGPSLQQTGSLVNRSWIFDSVGVRAVPEPGTWLMMVLGFLGLGVAMKRRHPRELGFH